MAEWNNYHLKCIYFWRKSVVVCGQFVFCWFIVFVECDWGTALFIIALFLFLCDIIIVHQITMLLKRYCCLWCVESSWSQNCCPTFTGMLKFFVGREMSGCLICSHQALSKLRQVNCILTYLQLWSCLHDCMKCRYFTICHLSCAQ